MPGNEEIISYCRIRQVPVSDTIRDCAGIQRPRHHAGTNQGEAELFMKKSATIENTRAKVGGSLTISAVDRCNGMKYCCVRFSPGSIEFACNSDRPKRHHTSPRHVEHHVRAQGRRVYPLVRSCTKLDASADLWKIPQLATVRTLSPTYLGTSQMEREMCEVGALPCYGWGA